MTAEEVKIPEKERKEPDTIKNASQWTEYHSMKNAVREARRWVPD